MNKNDCAVCGRQIQNATPASICLPFCGLGGEQALQNKAAQHGSLLLEPQQTRAKELADAQFDV